MSFVTKLFSSPKAQPQQAQQVVSPKAPAETDEQKRKRQRGGAGARRGLSTVLGGSGDSTGAITGKSLLGQ